MSYYKIFLVILIIFLKTGNVLSLENIFNVNNIEIIKESSNSNDELANKAIKKGFEKLLKKILLSQDIKKLSELKFSNIKELVSYYQIVSDQKNDNKDNVIKDLLQSEPMISVAPSETENALLLNPMTVKDGEPSIIKERLLEVMG